MKPARRRDGSVRRCWPAAGMALALLMAGIIVIKWTRKDARSTEVSVTIGSEGNVTPAGKADSPKGEARTAQAVDDKPTSMQLARVLSGHQNPVLRLQFTPDASRLVSASNGDHHEVNGNVRYHVGGTDNCVRVWDVQSGRQLRRFAMTEGSRYGPRDLAISSDGKLLAAAAGWVTANGPSEPMAYVWNLGDGRREHLFVVNDSSAVRAIAFSQDERALVMARSGPGGVHYWSMADESMSSKVPLEGNGPGIESPPLQLTSGARFILGGVGGQTG